MYYISADDDFISLLYFTQILITKQKTMCRAHEIRKLRLNEIGLHFFRSLSVLALLIVIFNLSIYAQSPALPLKPNVEEYVFNEIKLQNDAPIRDVLALLQDKHGFVWMAGTHGLMRYDGHDVKIYHNIPGDPSTLIDTELLSLHLLGDTLLCIGGVHGISLMDIRTEKITNLSRDQYGNPVEMVNNFFLDPDGTIWLAALNGLYSLNSGFEGITKHTINLPPITKGNPAFSKRVYCIAQHTVNPNLLMLGTECGLLSFDKKRNKLHKIYPNTEATFWRSQPPVYKFRQEGNYLWAMCWISGLPRFDMTTETWKNFSYPQTNDRLQTTTNVWAVNDFMLKNENELWVCDWDRGLFILDKNTQRLVQSEQIKKQAILNKQRLSIFQLSDGALWLSCAEGIWRQNLRAKQFKELDIPFSHEWVSATLHDEETDEYYFGFTWNSYGIACWNSIARQWSYYQPVTNKKEMFHTYDIFKDSRGVIWMGCSRGLWYVDKRSKMLKTFVPPDKDHSSLWDSGIYKIFEDSHKNLWLGTGKFGVIRLNRERAKANYFSNNPKDPTSLYGNTHFRAIEEDHRGRIWIGSRTGFCTFDPKTETFSRNIPLQLQKTGIRDSYTYSIVKDSTNAMWLTIEGQGLIKIKEEAKDKFKFKIYQTDDGLKDLVLRYMVTDKQGGLFMVNNGLLYLNPYDNSFMLTDERNGLLEDLNGDTKIMVDRYGNVFCGEQVGVGWLNEVEKHSQSNISNLIIENVSINSLPVTTWNPYLKNPVLYDVAHDRNNFTFSYTAICFEDYSQVRYRYKLEGMESEWNPSTQIPEARYTNLKPGKYRFVVDVSYKGVWLGYNRYIEFRIKQVYWKTGWFIVLVLLLSSAFVYTVYSYRKRQRQKRQQIRLKIASNLHDDVGSTLSSISIMSDLLQSSLDNGVNANHMLEKIGQNARDTMESMDDIIWSVNPRNDDFRNLIVRIREYAAPLFEPRDVRFSVSAPESIHSLHVPMEIRHNLFLIAKEAINNAAKYSGCTEASIEFAYSYPVLKMTITDNGKGFDTSLETNRNGLRNMKYRAEKTGGKLAILSALGKGTQIILSVKARNNRIR